MHFQGDGGNREPNVGPNGGKARAALKQGGGLGFIATLGGGISLLVGIVLASLEC